MLFLLTLKWNLWEKAFSSVTTKANPYFAVKVAGRSNHSFLFNQSYFSIICTLNTYGIIECIIELCKHNWFCKHSKKVRSSQPTILVLNWVKHRFSLWVSLRIKKKPGSKSYKKIYSKEMNCYFCLPVINAFSYESACNGLWNPNLKSSFFY